MTKTNGKAMLGILHASYEKKIPPPDPKPKIHESIFHLYAMTHKSKKKRGDREKMIIANKNPIEL